MLSKFKFQVSRFPKITKLKFKIQRQIFQIQIQIIACQQIY